MLVLSRKVGEEIVIDGNIVLSVVEITGNRVKIGIHAPRDKAVIRGELVGKGRDLDAVISEPDPSQAPSPGISHSMGLATALV
ncbi:MAG: carbon storage regulator [Planctomycetota bacterium]